MPQLARIAVYPLKSFEPIFVDRANVLSNGALEHDRRFALVDETGKFVNAKRFSSACHLRLKLDPSQRVLAAFNSKSEETHQWQIDEERTGLEEWLSHFFSASVRLIEDPKGGFPDDTDACGPTIVSKSSLETVASWFSGLSLDNIRLRFRANLEIEGVDPFWEDRLLPTTGTECLFRIGSVTFVGTNPCQRCVVPSRDPFNGEEWPEFAKRFAELRSQHLPEWAPRRLFTHFYRLTTNTRGLQQTSSVIRVGDDVAY